MLDPASQQPEFVAPLVAFSEDLLFRLTVTDDDGATDEAVVTITVVDDVPDTTAPETIFSTQVKKIKGAERYTIVLQPNESATTFFRFSGQGVITTGGDTILSWQLYTEPVVIQLQKNGSGSLEFYSEDSAGNVEATQLEVLQ